MTDTTPKIVSSGVKHEEIPVPMSVVRVERSKRRGSVLRREALVRLQQGKGEPPVDEDDGGGAPGGGGRRASSGESISLPSNLQVSTAVQRLDFTYTLPT